MAPGRLGFLHRLLERLGERGCAGVALLRLAGQRLQEHGLDDRRQARVHLARRGQGRLHVLEGDFHGGIGLVGHPAGEHLVEHHSEGVDVGAGIDGPAQRLLRRHVRRRPHQRGAG